MTSCLAGLVACAVCDLYHVFTYYTVVVLYFWSDFLAFRSRR